MSQAKQELVEALREGMQRTSSSDAAFAEINAAFHVLAHAMSDVTASAAMIGRLPDTHSGGDLDAMAASCLGGSYPIFIKPTNDGGFMVVVGLLVTSATGFPVELRVAEERHVAAGRVELEQAIRAFAASPHVARAVMACAAYVTDGSAPVVTTTRQ
jgi:hypothetical protein